MSLKWVLDKVPIDLLISLLQSPLGIGEKKEKHRLAEMCDTYSIIHIQKLYLADKIDNSEALLIEIHNGMTLRQLNSSTCLSSNPVILFALPISVFQKLKSTKFSVSLHTTMATREKEEVRWEGNRIDTFAFKHTIPLALLQGPVSSVVPLKTDTCCGSHKGSPWSFGWSDFPPGWSERFLWPKPVMVHSRLMAIKNIRLL